MYYPLIQNPKRSVNINADLQSVAIAVNGIPRIDPKYKLEAYNELINQFTLSSLEFLSLGVFIDINLAMVDTSVTSVTIEVRRKVGAFDQAHEVANAANHIQRTIDNITDLLRDPNIERGTASLRSEEILQSNANIINKIWTWICWAIAIIFFLSGLVSPNPFINIIIGLLFISKSIIGWIKK